MSPKSRVEFSDSDQSFSPLNDGSTNIISILTNTTPHDFILGLQTAIDQTGSYIFTKDTAGRYTYVNLKVQELFGATSDAIIGKNDSHFFDLEISNDISLNDRRVLDLDETIENEEVNVIKSTGEKRTYWTVKKSVKNIDGQIVGMCGVSTDITKLKRTENLLLESSKELNESQSIAGLGTYVLDIGTGVWKSSPILDEIFGIDERYQRTVDGWESIIYIDDRKLMHDYYFSEVIGNRKKFDKEYRIVSIADNKVCWVHGLGKLEFDNLKNPIKMHGTIQDITTRKLAEIDSFQNEMLLHATLESTDEGILMIAPGGHVLSTNKRFKDLWRIPQAILDSGLDDMLLKHVLDQLVDPNEFLSLVKKLYESDEEARDVLNFKDGRVFSRFTQSLQFGESKGRIWCFRDISDYKRIENELRKTKERYDFATEVGHLGTWDWNPINGILIWSNETFRLMGFEPDSITPTYELFRNLVNPEDWELLDKKISEALKYKKPYSLDCRVVQRDGGERICHATGSVEFGLNDQPTRMLGTIQDITERKLIEQSLRHESEKNIALLRNTSDGTHILNTEGNIIEASDSFCDMLGYEYKEIIGMNVSQWDDKFHGEELIELVRKLFANPERSEFETLHRRKDGAVIDVEVSSSSLELGGTKLLFCSSRNITERKQAEITHLKTQNELEEAQRIAHIGSWSLNIVTNEISWSEELYFMQGLNPNLTPPNFTESQKLFMPESWARLSSAIALTVTSGVSFELELEMARTDGSQRWMLGRGEAVRDEIGSIISVRGIAEDITERKLSEIALKESELRYQIIFDTTPLPMWIIDDSSLTFLMVNNYAVDHYGYSREEFSKMTLRDIRPKEDISELDRVVTNYPDRRSVGEWRHKKKDGTIINVLINTVPMRYGDSQARIAIVQDITERKLVEKNLSITASVFGISQEGIAITDAANNIIEVNPAFTTITGYSREEAIGKNPNILSSGRQGKDFYENMWNALKNEGLWRGEIWNRRKAGEIYPEMLSISVLQDDKGKVLSHVAVFSDISNLKQHEDELVRVAHFDALTSIPNRILLADRMRQAISQTSRDKNLMAVCYLDLDGFKPINDSMGHQVGDDVLIEIARRIGFTIRGGDTVARLGGDEFVVLLLGLAKGEECVTTLERLLEAIAAPIGVKNKTVSVTASIGVSIYPLDEEDPDTLLRHADQAMYIAKQSGKNRFHIFDVKLDKRARDQNDFLNSIRTALEQNQFELHYQPKVNLRTKELVGAEALIRWRHPENGLLSPAEFLRHVDNTDLDIAIGEWVTATALAQIHHWQSLGFDIEVSINISGYHLESKGFVRKLQQQLANYPALPVGKIQIEVLETVALNDVSVVQEIIESCRNIGVGFALDDFGTGYSSLSYLSALPVDTLKIDQSFVRDMMEDKGDKAIVQGIIALAKAFGRQTVAEGIETQEHYQALLDMGCEEGQGYGIARPMSANELINWKPNFR